MSSAPAPAKYEALSQANDPTWKRLEDEIDWYDRNSRSCQRIYKSVKIIEIVAAALIPFLSALNISTGNTTHLVGWIIGGLGVLITILEGLLQLGQYQQNWVSYRSTCEALKHEKYTYLAQAPPYKDTPDPHALLAGRVESLVSQEHAKWASVQQQEHKVKLDNAGKGSLTQSPG